MALLVQAGNFGILNALLLTVLPFSMIAYFASALNPVPNFAVCLVLGILAGILELPFCFTCCQFCVKIEAVLAHCWCDKMWMRCIFYILAATILIVLQVHDQANWMGSLLAALLILNSMLYFLAVCSPAPDHDKDQEKGESHGTAPAETRDDARARVKAEDDARRAAAGFGGGLGGAGGGSLAGALMSNEAVQNAALSAASDPAVQKAAIGAVRDNPGLAAEALKAARRV